MPKTKRPLIIALAWALVIFATSCTFIERSVFIRFVEQFLPGGMPRHLWINFWGAFGLVVVKGYHVTEYTILCGLLQSVLRSKWKDQPHRALWAAAVLAFCFAASDEWHQTFVPGRGGTWVDVMIDSIGITLATAAGLRRLRKQQDVHADD